MSVKQLKEVARKEALEYYPTSGISFGNNPDYSKIVDNLLKDSTKTNLIKDIKSLQKKNKKH